jgi:hypothetical protein
MPYRRLLLNRIYNTFSQVILLCSIYSCLMIVTVSAIADERPRNQTLWVATPVTMRAAPFGIPLSENSLTADLRIYFGTDGTAYITVSGSRETSKGLVLPVNQTVVENRFSDGYITIKMLGVLSDLYIEFITSMSQPNFTMDVRADWRVNISTSTCFIVDKHFNVSVPGNALMNSAIVQSVGTAACAIYPGHAFL